MLFQKYIAILIVPLFLASVVPAAAATFNVTGTGNYTGPPGGAFDTVFGPATINIAVEFDVQPIVGGETITAASGSFSWSNGANHVFVSSGFVTSSFGNVLTLRLTPAAALPVNGMFVDWMAVTFNFGAPVPADFSGQLGSALISLGAQITEPGVGTGAAFGSVFDTDTVVGTGPLPDHAVVPLPGSLPLVLLGLATLAVRRHHARTRTSAKAHRT